jgi:autotransporter-associated beta strand protein
VTLEGDLNLHIDSNNSDRRVTVNGNITGVGGLDFTRGNNGHFRLAGANTYSGATTINANADVYLMTTNGIGDSSAVTLAGAGSILRLNAVGTETVGSIASSGAFGKIVLGGNVLITGGNGASTTYGGVIEGTSTSSGLIKVGAGTMTLSGANTYIGKTEVNEGILALANPLGLQNSALVTTSAGKLSLDDGITSLNFGGLSGESGDLATIILNYGNVTSLTLNPAVGSVLTYGGVIADGATGMTLTKTGAGTQILSGANTYTGTTTVSGGTLVASNSNLTANIRPDSTEIIFPTQPSVGIYNVLPGPLNTASLPASFSGTGGLTATLANSPNLKVIVSSGPTFGTTYPVGSEDLIGPNGLKNLMSYALGGTGPSSTPALPVLTSDGTSLTLTANIREDGQGVGVVGEYAYSLDGPWNTVVLDPTGTPSTVPNTIVKAFSQAIEPESEPGKSKKFLRLRATLIP